jgi:COP9 signalosome complex subunit 12
MTNNYTAQFQTAVIDDDGVLMAKLLDLTATHKSSKVPGQWSSIVQNYFKARHALKTKDLATTFQFQCLMVNEFNEKFPNLTRWVLPVLYKLNSQLLEIATQIGEESMEECCRIMNKSFSVCITDRYSALEQSRKWGYLLVNGSAIYMANLLFKTYFKLSSFSLCTNMLKSMDNADLPQLSSYPTSDQTTFKYYSGVLHFHNDAFDACAEEFEFARSRTVGLGEVTLHNQMYIHITPD